MPFYYSGKVKVPFEPKDNLLGLSILPNLSIKQEQELNEYARELKLQPEEVGKSVLDDNVRVFRFRTRVSEQERQRIQQRLFEHPLIRLVGPILHIERERVVLKGVVLE